MKRIIAALFFSSIALSAFADADEDRVLAEARRRAERDRAEAEADEAREEAREAIKEAREESREADAGNDIFLPIALSVLPGSPLPGRDVDSSLGLGLIISVLDDVYGLQASSIGSVAEGSVSGTQLSGIFSVSEGRVGGFQGSGIFNVAEDDVAGFQSAGVFNIAEGYLGGGQSAGVFNIAGEGGPIQIAGVFNIAERDFTGFQIAGIFNIVQDLEGVQSAGIFNIAREVHGFQIGVVNVADSVFGLQVGLVNIVINGISDMGVWVEDSGSAYAFMQRGTSNFYTLVYAGAPKDDWFVTDERISAGLGGGFRIGGYRRWEPAFDFDVSAKARIDSDAIQTACEDGTWYFPKVFPSARASIRLPVGIGLALHAGYILDAEYEGGNSVPEEFQEGDAWSTSLLGVHWTFHPKLFLGLSL
ncbi:MAG TPA: hypothetical protein DIC34_18035 [Treponema sp.]|nr:MAG: hypothetical protein A2Y36_18350 [Treponema sp. GWA1_62_8]OHE67458.1 MAG: hypothetical protein A2001_07610 [Treponema sp. GWC1_61_84]OHE71969.1 MAG: hypothetical protein A2413_00720 [Treponema sp. RIFOXYC1_FULL_61_9]HCM28401.1 hypothetical protein [Treponema sp.]